MDIVTYVTDIILADINGYSELSTHLQLASAKYITEQVRAGIDLLLAKGTSKATDVFLGFIPTGDGFYVLLTPALAGYGIFLAITLRAICLMKRRGGALPFSGLRIGVHNGEVAPFEDILTRTNFVGDGMNTSARLLDVVPGQSPTAGIPKDQNSIVVSEAAHHWFKQLCGDNSEMTEYLKTLQYEESDWFNLTDKHHKVHRARFVEASHYAAIELP